MSARRGIAGLRAVALFEGAKGAVVLLAGAGVLELAHGDARRLAEELVGALHMNPDHRFAHAFVADAARFGGASVRWLAALAALYAAARFVEAVGLWRARAWAQWFGIASGSVYLSIELVELARRATWVRAGVLALNVALVAYLAWTRRAARRAGEELSG